MDRSHIGSKHKKIIIISIILTVWMAIIRQYIWKWIKICHHQIGLSPLIVFCHNIEFDSTLSTNSWHSTMQFRFVFHYIHTHTHCLLLFCFASTIASNCNPRSFDVHRKGQEIPLKEMHQKKDTTLLDLGYIHCLNGSIYNVKWHSATISYHSNQAKPKLVSWQ